ncbi:Basic-leucine zipper domain [Phytophthora cactorum]|nr:Basic-leucine zipper domain [Phytophthora cactorum]
MEESVLYPPNLRSSERYRDHRRYAARQAACVLVPSDPSALLSLQKSQLPSVHLAVSLAARGCHVSQVTADLSTHQSELDKVALRRERNRMHQSRYKMKQLKKVEDLETSIQQLQEEVQQLKLKKYFRMFRYGVRVSGLPSRSVAVVATSSPFTAEAQRRFILSTMMASVTSETGHSVDALMENWGFVSKFHPDIDVQLVSLEYTADGLVIGKTLGRLTITENTLYHAFPHLIGAGEGEKRAELARRLLGQQLVMRGAVHFDGIARTGELPGCTTKQTC